MAIQYPPGGLRAAGRTPTSRQILQRPEDRRLNIENIRSQIALRQAQAGATGQPKTLTPSQIAQQRFNQWYAQQPLEVQKKIQRLSAGLDKPKKEKTPLTPTQQAQEKFNVWFDKQPSEVQSQIQRLGAGLDKPVTPKAPTTKLIGDRLYEYKFEAKKWEPLGIKTEPTRGEVIAQANTLRKEFNATKAVKNYQTTVRSEAAMRKALELSKSPDTKSRIASDQALGVLFQKMLDPDSVVRESEYARTGEGASALSKIKAFIPKLQKGGLGISDDDRDALHQIALVLLDIEKAAMNKAIDRYTSIANDYGVDPRLIFGNIKKFPLSEQAALPTATTDPNVPLQQKPIYADNPQTGQSVVSTDGGKTWQPAQ